MNFSKVLLVLFNLIETHCLKLMINEIQVIISQSAVVLHHPGDGRKYAIFTMISGPRCSQSRSMLGLLLVAKGGVKKKIFKKSLEFSRPMAVPPPPPLEVWNPNFFFFDPPLLTWFPT